MLITGDGWQLAGLGLFFALFSVPFAGLGLFLVIGQWIAAAQAHRRIRYALSSKAAYVATSWRTDKLESYPILPKTALEIEHGTGYDSVWFHARSETDSDGGLTTSRVGFEGIKDGTEVYRLMHGIQTGQT